VAWKTTSGCNRLTSGRQSPPIHVPFAPPVRATRPRAPGVLVPAGARVCRRPLACWIARRGRITSQQASRLRHTRAPCGGVEGRKRSGRCRRSAAGSEARAPVPACSVGVARVCRRPLACWSALRGRITSKQASRLKPYSRSLRRS
jgi:hypothetical protein